MRPDHAFTPIVSERLTLRRSEPDDAETISAYRSLPEVYERQGWTRTDPEHVREIIVEMLELVPGDPGWVQFSVLRHPDGHLVGDVGLCPADDEPGVIKVGYTIAPEHQGQGYATEAVRALVGYAFETLDARVVRAYTEESNEPSRAVMRKSGLTHIETTVEEEDGEVWRIVRYERARDL
jgi:RimJ/RimL family protein N-acetyltransferase